VALVSTICVGSWGYDPAGNGSVSANNKYNMP
jgi:hypothetical protein